MPCVATMALATLSLLTSVPASAAPPKGAPGRKPSKVVIPPGAPPVISTTHREPSYREAQQRLARFITALQAGKRQRAVTFFSSRVLPAERQAFLTDRWLRRDRGSSSFTQVLFFRDLQITAKGVIQGDRVRLLVMPRTIPYAGPNPKKSRGRTVLGALVVPMRMEYGKWFVELRPERARPKA